MRHPRHNPTFGLQSRLRRLDSGRRLSLDTPETGIAVGPEFAVAEFKQVGRAEVSSKNHQLGVSLITRSTMPVASSTASRTNSRLQIPRPGRGSGHEHEDKGDRDADADAREGELEVLRADITDATDRGPIVLHDRLLSTYEPVALVCIPASADSKPTTKRGVDLAPPWGASEA